MTTALLNQLPLDLLRETASFLTCRDVACLGSTSTEMHKFTTEPEFCITMSENLWGSDCSDLGHGRRVPFQRVFLRPASWWRNALQKRAKFEHKYLNADKIRINLLGLLGAATHDGNVLSLEEACRLLVECHERTSFEPIAVPRFLLDQFVYVLVRLLGSVGESISQTLKSFRCPDQITSYLDKEILSETHYKHAPTAVLEEVLTVIFKALRVLMLNEANRQVLGRCSSDGCSLFFLIQHVLRQFPHASQLIASVACCVTVFSRPLGAVEGKRLLPISFGSMWIVEQMVNVGIHKDLFEVLKLHHEDPNVMFPMLWAAVNLSLTKDGKQFFATNGLVEIALDLLKTFPDHEYLQHRAIFSMVNIALLEDVQKAIGAKGGVPLLLGALRRFNSNEELTMCTCVLVKHMIFDNAENRQLVRECGGSSYFSAVADKFKNTPLSSLAQYLTRLSS